MDTIYDLRALVSYCGARDAGCYVRVCLKLLELLTRSVLHCSA